MALDKTQLFSLLAVFVLTFSATTGLASLCFGSSVYVPWVWHNIGIYVRADGSVDPPDAPIERLGNVYTLKSDTFASIAIQCNNSIFDGNGYLLYGSGYGTGLLLQNANNVLVKNLNAQHFGQGIYFDNCNNSIIKQSKLVSCGIIVMQSSGNQLLNNDVGGDLSIDYGANNTVTGNNASSVSISWSTNINVKNNHFADAKLTNVQLILGNYTEGIYVDNSGNCTIQDNTVEYKNVGVDIWQSTNVTLNRNKLRENQVGFKLWGTNLQQDLPSIDTTNTVNDKPAYLLVNRTNYEVPSGAGWIFALNCKNLTIRNWVSEPNWGGIVLMNTADSKIVNCTVSGNYNGIQLDNVSNCTVTQNTITRNSNALNFEDALNCNITENEVANNYFMFDLLQGTTNNTFLHNDFLGNQTGPIENRTRNQWDDYSQGNYWGTFTGVDRDHNGISDSPYLIDVDSGETDRFPMMQPLNASVTVQSPGAFLAMPEEYLNYTLTNVNGALRAKIDGVYPIHGFLGGMASLPMVYPIPPNTTNIHLRLNGAELNWTDFASVDPTARHQTDIGDWQMIYCTLFNLSSDFLLEIHYEHPVQVINGSYTFLYDLNISPYLSVSSVVSTAHFNVELPFNSSTLNIYRTGINGSEWQPVNSTFSENAQTRSVTFDVVSEYDKPLLGDVAFVLRSAAVPEFPAWIILLIMIFVAAVTAGVFRKRALKSGQAVI